MSNKYEIELQVENDIKICKRENPDIHNHVKKHWESLKEERKIWLDNLKRECVGKTEDEIFWIKCREIGRVVNNIDDASKRIDDLILRQNLSKLYS